MSADAVIDAWLARLGDRDIGPAALFLFASSAIEHVLPPFPGDLAVALGAAVVVAKHWPLVAMYLSSVGGGAAGSALTFHFGRWLHDRGAASPSPRVARWRATVEPVARMLQRRGALALVLSRFVPVGRALAIIAAGYAGVGRIRALVAATAGCALWNAALFAAGTLLGLHRSRIAGALQTYGRVVGAVLVLALGGWALLRWRRRTSVSDRPSSADP